MAKTRKRRFGDRYEGRRIRTLPSYNGLVPFIMKKRNDANNCLSDTIEITEIERYLRQKRTNGYPGMGLLHVFIAAYIRVVAQYPAVNRFVSGQRIFARNNIVFVMVVKKGMNINAPETSKPDIIANLLIFFNSANAKTYDVNAIKVFGNVNDINHDIYP